MGFADRSYHALPFFPPAVLPEVITLLVEGTFGESLFTNESNLERQCALEVTLSGSLW